MLTIDIPGGKTLEISFLVLDCNGTIALDGEILSGVPQRLTAMAGMLQIHILTADTHGTVAEKVAGLPCTLTVIADHDQDLAKLAILTALDPQKTIVIGNGRNDRLMLQEAALGIGIIGQEGASTAAILAADLLCADINDALDLLLSPKRLQATLRN
jgi:soluble P-type ATPase